jgi:hypothetical protein
MLVGRGAELARVEQLLAGARLGTSAVLVTSGEPGIGKTALLQHAIEQARDMTVLQARGVESEAEIPFAGLYALLRRVIEAFPAARARVEDLRMIVVAGPRIDPASLPVAEGLEIRAYVHDLYRHLAACDLAVVQGGLTTAMELTANKRPFLAFPLRHHFEQNLHVRYRLERYGAGRFLDFETDGPEEIAQEIGREVAYADVETGSAARAAALIAELL